MPLGGLQRDGRYVLFVTCGPMIGSCAARVQLIGANIVTNTTTDAPLDAEAGQAGSTQSERCAPVTMEAA
jgi:hypothetical protein